MSFLASGEVNVADRAPVFFFIQSIPSGQFTASAISRSGEVWTSSYGSEEWIKIYEEGGASSNEQFFEWLNDANSKITAETNDDRLEMKWTKEDEEGFFFEICSLHLMREPSDALIHLIRALLNDRSAFYEKATNAEAEVGEMRNQMEKLEQRPLYEYFHMEGKINAVQATSEGAPSKATHVVQTSPIVPCPIYFHTFYEAFACYAHRCFKYIKIVISSPYQN